MIIRKGGITVQWELARHWFWLREWYWWDVFILPSIRNQYDLLIWLTEKSTDSTA